jgi:hypothetical protein
MFHCCLDTWTEVKLSSGNFFYFYYIYDVKQRKLMFTALRVMSYNMRCKVGKHRDVPNYTDLMFTETLTP